MQIETIKHGIQVIAKEHALDVVVLFGSHATDRVHTKSDIDIGVLSRKKILLPPLMTDFSKALAYNDVDVVDLGRASPTLMRAVVAEGILLYEATPSAYLKWTLYAIKTWMETAWLRVLRDRQLIEWAAQ